MLILVLGPTAADPSTLSSRSPTASCLADKAAVSRQALPAYLIAQVTGAIAGVILANAMFTRPLVKWSQHYRSNGHVFLGEIVATAGLILIVVVLSRGRRTSQMPWVVGIYIGAAYWFTSSTSFANPAPAIGRASQTPLVGSRLPRSVFIAAEFLGGAVALALASGLYPKAREPTRWKGAPQEARIPSAESMLEETG